MVFAPKSAHANFKRSMPLPSFELFLNATVAGRIFELRCRGLLGDDRGVLEASTRTGSLGNWPRRSAREGLHLLQPLRRCQLARMQLASASGVRLHRASLLSETLESSFVEQAPSGRSMKRFFGLEDDSKFSKANFLVKEGRAASQYRPVGRLQICRWVLRIWCSKVSSSNFGVGLQC